MLVMWVSNLILMYAISILFVGMTYILARGHLPEMYPVNILSKPSIQSVLFVFCGGWMLASFTNIHEYQWSSTDEWGKIQ